MSEIEFVALQITGTPNAESPFAYDDGVRLSFEIKVAWIQVFVKPRSDRATFPASSDGYVDAKICEFTGLVESLRDQRLSSHLQGLFSVSWTGF